jgi:anaerobic selenocysteine-containing dehydrogenase
MVTRYTCNLCDALCGLAVTVENGRIVDIRGDAEDPFSRGHVCPKGPALRELDEDPARIRTPQRRTADGWQSVSWDEALGEAAERLRAIQAKHGRDAVAIYVGNPTAHSHRAGLGSQLLTWALGSRNRFDANSQDANPRLFACWQMYGDPLSMPVPDVERCDFLLLLGCNPAASNGSMMSLGDVKRRLQAVKRKVLIDPRRNETAAWCDEHHFLRPGGDAALLLAMLHVLFAEGVDARAVDAIASGREELERISRAFAPERVAARVGIAADTIRRLARELRDTPRAALYARIGTSQNPFGPTANWLVEAVNLISGHFDREGGWMFPDPAADVSALGRRVVGHARWRSRVRGLPEFLGALPSAVMAEEMETPGDRQIRALVCFAGNPVLSTPNGARLARALERLDYHVAIDFQMSETAKRAHLVLPPGHVFSSSNFNLFFFGLASRNIARFDAPILPVREGARDDWQILFELALRMRGVPRASSLARRFRDLPDRVIDLLLRFGRRKLSLAELASHPHGIDFGALEPARKRRVHTPGNRVQLAPEPLTADVARVARWLDEPAPPLVLIGRRHLRSNNSWMHTRGPRNTRLQMHPLDAAERQLADGARVRVASRTGTVDTELELTDALARGVVSLPHGFASPSANDITDELLVEPLCGGSILNGVPVTIARSS